MSGKKLGGRSRLSTCGAVVVTASLAVGVLATSASADPSIGRISGATVGPLSGGVGVVTLTGSELDDVTRVWFGATPVTRFVRESDTTIHVTPPAARAAGKVDVTVGDEQGEATPTDSEDDYEYTAAPVLSKVEAVAVAPSAVKNHLEISGSQLKGASVVLVGDIAVKVTPALNPAGATTVKVKAPAVKGGAYRVAVVTPQGIGSLDNAYGAVPAISKVYVPKTVGLVTTQVPALRGSDLGGDVVHLAGSGFTGLKSVSFGKAQSTSVVVESDTVARVVVPAKSAGDVYAALAPNTLKVKVVAENAFGTGTAGPQFQYDAKPTVTALDTTASHATSATNTVTITGTNLKGAKVRFGTVFGVVDTTATNTGTSLTVKAPKKGTQPVTVDLTVVTVAGEHKLVGRWTFSATAPASKTPWPAVVVTPTPTPTDEPTPAPSETPTGEPTAAPSETPTETPAG